MGFENAPPPKTAPQATPKTGAEKMPQAPLGTEKAGEKGILSPALAARVEKAYERQLAGTASPTYEQKGDARYNAVCAVGKEECATADQTVVAQREAIKKVGVHASTDRQP